MLYFDEKRRDMAVPRLLPPSEQHGSTQIIRVSTRPLLKLL